MLTPQYWIGHPGRNPTHRFGKGRDRWTQGAKQRAKYLKQSSRD